MNNENSGEAEDGRIESPLNDSINSNSKARQGTLKYLAWFRSSRVTHELLFIPVQLLTKMHQMLSSGGRINKSAAQIWVKFPHSPILHYAFSSWIEKTMTKTILTSCVSVVVSSDFCRFCLFYHRCYSVIRRRCQTIQPLLPSSSAHSPACGQNILFLRSQEFFFVGHTNIHSQISYLKIFVPALTNEPAFNQLQRTLASGYKTRYVV